MHLLLMMASWVWRYMAYSRVRKQWAGLDPAMAGGRHMAWGGVTWGTGVSGQEVDSRHEQGPREWHEC